VDLRELASVVWKWRLLVVCVVVLSGAAGTIFAVQRAPTYESTSTIAIEPDLRSQGVVSADALSALLGTYAETAESDIVRDAAEENLGHDLIGTVNATTEAGTGVLRISVRAQDADDARDTADAVTTAFLDRLAGNPDISATLVTPASVPDTPVQPRPPLIIGTSLLVGFGVAILLAIAIDRFRRRIVTADDLSEISPLPLLGQIQRNRRLLRSDPQIVWDDPRLREIQENFRSLRTNIQLTTGSNPLALQITSAGPTQGKSTVTANLGIAFADLGVSTVVVDADLRRPVQQKIFGLSSKGGTWTGPQRVGSKAGRKTQFANLAVLPAGTPLIDPTELLQVRFPELLEKLRSSFELILVDTPPLLPVSDARITAGWLDGVVIVLASGEERPAALIHAIDQLALSHANLNGFVINKVASTGEGYHYRSPGVDLASPEEEKGASVVTRGASNAG
jgi:tyrosine-protein kinase